MTSNNPLTRSKKRQAVELLRSNRWLEAKTLCEKICHADRRDAEAWYMLGATHQHLNELDRAAACYSQVVALKPDHAEAHYYLGNILREQGKSEEAVAAYQRVLALRPDFLEACGNLGAVLESQQKFEDAVQCYVLGLRYHPDSAELHYNLGNAFQALRKYEEAARSYVRAVQIKPNLAQAHCNLGVVLAAQGKWEEAVTSYQRALQIDPHYAEAWNNLGQTLIQLGRLDEAVAATRNALAARPNCPEFYTVLGDALKHQGHPEEAVAAYGRASEIRPAYPEARNALGNALLDQGKVKDAISSFHKAIESKADYAIARSNLLLALNYSEQDVAAIFAEHIRFGQCYARTQTAHAYSNVPDPARRLRIGYVSPDFRTHSVAYFIELVIASHDAVQVEIYCYSDSGRPDTMTARLKGHVAQWRDIHGKSDEQVVELIRADGIDILVDLAGHTGHNRLPLFARKPAPVQVTYLGYPNTTGLAAMDYRLTDALADPPGQEAFHTEELVRLPTGFLCYAPPLDAPTVMPPPAQRAGYVTFGCFNMLLKIRPEAIELWARLLDALPGSRLMLKNKSFSDPATCERVYRLFEENGVPRGCLELVGWVPSRADHVALYNRIDIALDTFPYNGTTTTCEALWMGVPVVTLAGNRHAARVGVSLLAQIGLSELIAKSPDDYVHIATELASDPNRLAALRIGLRERMRNSPLCDAQTFTRNLEQAYREMWRKWCSEQRTATS